VIGVKGSKRTILDVFGVTSLKDISVVVEKLESGIDVNTVDSGARTLLMEASIRKNHALLEVLLNFGADPNLREEKQWTALHFAAQENDPVSIRLLLESGADANAQNDYGNSVISTAVLNSRGEGDSIKLLLEYGANPSVKNKSGISAIDLANRISNYDVIRFFR
jgi:uncharacterized protein